MIQKLRKKLILVSMLSLFAVLFLIVSVSTTVSYLQMAQSADSTLNMLARNDGKFPKGREPFKRSPELPFESRFFSVRLTADGELLAANLERIAAIEQDTAVAFAEKILASGKKRGFIGIYRYSVQDTPEGTMILFLDCGRSFYNFKNFFITSVLVSILGMTVVLILIVFFSERIIRPITESYEKQKRFITDAGHEIKTPLAIINADADVLGMDLGENEWLDEIKAQTRRLTALTNDLISLTRMEEAGEELQMTEFSLSDLVQEAAQSFQGMSLQKEQTFNLHITPGLMIRGDEKMLARLLSILLDNALKYCPAQGTIDLELGIRGKQLFFKLTNSAESVDSSDLPRLFPGFGDADPKLLFDRFYRADHSRNSKTGGYGIGLSIARAIVDAHKGKISAATADGRSLTITVLLPAAPAAPPPAAADC